MRTKKTIGTITRGERGTALLAVLLLSVVILALVLFAFADNRDTTDLTAVYRHTAEVQAAAEYGAELAVAELTTGITLGPDAKGRESIVLGDWVYGKNGENLYRTDDGDSTDQRRITGVFDNHEFRVRVRSARLAHDVANGGAGRTMPEKWLLKPKPFMFGMDDIYEGFDDVYEITSTARKKGGGNARSASSSTVRAVVGFRNNHPLRAILDLGALFCELPSRFQVTGGVNKEKDYINDSIRDAYSATISGEDHYFTKYSCNDHFVLWRYRPVRRPEDPAYYIPPPVSKYPITSEGYGYARVHFFYSASADIHNGYYTLHARDRRRSPHGINPFRPRYLRHLCVFWENAWLQYHYYTSLRTGTRRLDGNNVEGDVLLLGGKLNGRAGDAYLGKYTPCVSLGGVTRTGWAMYSGHTLHALSGVRLHVNDPKEIESLYINKCAPAWARVSHGYYGTDVQEFSDPHRWKQVYIGKHTNTPGESTLNPGAWPVLSGNKNRCQSMHILHHPTKHNCILVREYEKDGKYYPYPVKDGVWNGNYTWGIFIPWDRIFSGWPWLQWDIRPLFRHAYTTIPMVPRVIMWQELMGWSLAKDPDGAPALRSDGTGRTYYRLDGSGRRIPVGFDETYQRTNGSGHVRDADDPVYVRQDDGSLKEHRGIHSFVPYAIIAGIAINGGERAGHGSAAPTKYNYSELMLAINVEQNWGEYTPLFTNRQWWEREAQEGLTGGRSRPALVTSREPVTLAQPGEPLENNYDQLRHSPKGGSIEDAVYTMLDQKGEDHTDFARAEFQMNGSTERYFARLGDHSTGILHPDIKQKQCIEKGITSFYYTESDLAAYIQNKMHTLVYRIKKYGLVNSSYRSIYEPLLPYCNLTSYRDLSTLDKVQSYNTGLALTEIVSLNSDILNFSLKHVDKRWEHNTDAKLKGSGPTSYALAKNSLSLRRLAGEIIGGAVVNAPAVKTQDFRRLDPQAEPTPEPLYFLAGEVRPESDLSLDALPKGSVVPHRSGAMKQPDGSATGVRDFTAATPAEAVARCYVGFFRGSSMGRGRNHPWSSVEIDTQALHGLKDRRHSIGFHRCGTDQVHDGGGNLYTITYGKYLTLSKLLRDHYEIVSLGVSGFNPYRENEDGPERYIASEKNDQGSYRHTFKYAADNAASNPAPDFVFDKPIDGAGTMVVNGNLVITDTFAYHGILIVLGDVRIVPTLKHDQLLYDRSGLAVSGKYFNRYGDLDDSDGGTLFLPYSSSPSYSDRWWYYTNWGQQCFSVMDAFGRPLLDKDGRQIPVKPRTVSEYRGELIVQGCLMVKGRIITEQVDNALVPGEKATGKLRLYWSREAVIDTGSIWAKSKSFVNRISWAQDEEDVDVSSLWEDKLD